MSNIAIKGATTGTGVFTLESPATNTDRTLVLPDEAGTLVTTASLPNPLTSGTAVAATSGTLIDFTGIPSWVKCITVIFNGVSLSGAANLMVRVGTSSGFETTGYTGTVFGNGSQTQWASGGYQITRTGVASSTYSGALVLFNVSGNIWVAKATMADGTNAYSGFAAGTKTLAELLTQVRIISTNGTDTFDAGSINIMYE
jgi:hypothetical protein